MDGKQILGSGEEGEEVAIVEGASQVTELKRLKYLAQTVSADCGVVPVGAFIENAEKNIVPNMHFRGVKYPEKLESYIHQLPGPNANAHLGKDPRGTWTVRFDGVLGKALVRSTIWTGYTFFLDTTNATFGGLYVGTGVRNMDLIFML